MTDQPHTTNGAGDATRQHALVALPFHGDEIVTFRANGEPHVAMRRIVENLGMSWSTQRQRIERETDRFSWVHIDTTGADGKCYEMLAMPARKLPLWLATINPNKVAEAVRPKLELYQAESAVALHDYWTRGAAIRGDLDGVLTEIDPAARKVLGGIIKGIVHKEIGELLPALVRETVGANQFGVVHGMTAGDVLDAAGMVDRRGMRGLARRASDRLRRFHAERSKPVRLATLGRSSAYVFDPLTAREWLADGGKASIETWVAERRGQGVLKLIPKA